MLLDAHDPIRRGGTGRTIDWTVAAATAAHAAPVILLGRPDAGERRRARSRPCAPYAVDVSSGVEASPGVKDPAKLRAFFAAVAVRALNGTDARSLTVTCTEPWIGTSR